jgi:hypothetical protein
MFSLLSFILFSFSPFVLHFFPLFSSLSLFLFLLFLDSFFPYSSILLPSSEIRTFHLDRWPYSAPSAALPNNSELTVPTSKTPPEQESILETIMALTPTSHPGCP